MQLVILESAIIEVNEASHWYRQQEDERLARRFLSDFDQTSRRIAAYPYAYPTIDAQLRRARLQVFPWGVLYHVNADQITVLAVGHLHRDLAYWTEKSSKNR